MTLEDRRAICMAATTNTQFKFFDNNVPETRVYELHSEDEIEEITAGILCPVIPPALIHQKNESSPLLWSSIQSPTAGYTFGGIDVITLSRKFRFFLMIDFFGNNMNMWNATSIPNGSWSKKLISFSNERKNNLRMRCKDQKGIAVTL